jgi:hypothetical protein
MMRWTGCRPVPAFARASRTMGTWRAAVEHGLTLCSTDGDRARFEGPGSLNPLA